MSEKVNVLDTTYTINKIIIVLNRVDGSALFICHGIVYEIMIKWYNFTVKRRNGI